MSVGIVSELPEFAGTERFEIRRRLGAGGMGTVYEAYDHERGRPVALKTLAATDLASRGRLRREFLALRDLEHPNLVRLGELQIDDDHCFFTMELIHGQGLLGYIRDQAAGTADGATSYDEQRLRDALAQLAQGIDAIHGVGKLHRDVKPSNVLVTAAGRVVLLDFGLVSEISPESGAGDDAAGTATHMAPEQSLAEDLGPAVDWYALGVVLYDALTGHLPHTGISRFELLEKKQRRTPPPPRQRVPGVPTDLDELCVELLRIEPARRPGGREILERLGVRREASAADRWGTPEPTVADAMPFVGRRQELEILRAAYEDRKAQAPGAVFVHGESGLGKTELVAQFVRRLTSDYPDLVVLFSRCHERAATTYGAFSGIAENLARVLASMGDASVAALLPERAGLLPALFPALLQVKAISAAPIELQSELDPHEQRTRMFSAFRELLARLARSRSVLLVIDDLQWAGPDSLMLLGEVLQTAGAPELLLLGTARPGVGTSLDRHVSGEVRHIHLQELSAERARELVTRMAPALSTEETLAIAQEAGGHPMFVQELVRHLSGGGAVGETRLDEALWGRISDLQPHPRQLLEVLAVAGRPVVHQVAAAAAGLTYAQYERAARQLRVGFLARTGRQDADTVEPYHDRVREALLVRLDAARRARGHRELAVVLERAGAGTTDPQFLVLHFIAAQEPACAAEHAATAAARAHAMSAFDQAASLFQTAIELGTHSASERRSLQLSWAQALVAAGRGPEAADVFLAVAHEADGFMRLDCQRQAAEQLLISGHLERGLEAMRDALDEVGVTAPSTARRALFSLLWQRAKLRIRGVGWKEKRENQISLQDLTRVDLFKAAGHGLGLIDIVSGMDFQARGLLLALRTGEPSRVARAIIYEATLVCAGGPKRLGRAQSLLAKGTAIADSLADPYLDAWKITGIGCLQYFCGELREAAGNFATAESMFREQVGATWELSSMRVFRMWSLHRIGALAEMKPLLRDYVRDAERRGDRYARTTLVHSCHRVLLGSASQDAQQALELADWIPSEGRYHLQHWYQFASRAESALFGRTSHSITDDVRESERRIRQSFLLRVHPVRMDFLWLRARLIVANSATSRGKKAELREVGGLASRLEAESVGFAAVMAKLLRAAVAVQQAAPERACSLLQAAIGQAEQQHMFLHAGAAQLRLGEILGGDEGAELITGARARMEKQGAADACRMTEMLAPGYTRE